jgi:hypothetical protein
MATEKQQHAMIISSLCAVLHIKDHNAATTNADDIFESTDNGRQIGSALFNFVVTHQNRETEKRFDRMKRCCWLGVRKIKKNEIHLIALGFCHPISVTQRRQQQVYGLYFIGRWIGSAFVTS